MRDSHRGDLDILCGTPGQDRLYLNNGTGTFTDVTATRMPTDSDHTRTLTLGDIDGDGDLDLVGSDRRQCRVYTNLHRQLNTPVSPAISQPYDIEFYSQPGYATAPHTGLALLAFHLAPVPLPVPGLGTFFLDRSSLFQLPPAAIPQTTGRGRQRLAIPGDPALIGLVPYLQALIVNNSTGAAHFTGFAADTIR